MNEPTTSSGDERQDPIIPHNINDLNLPPNTVNILAKLGVVQPVTRQCDKRDSNFSPVPSELSSFSMAPMNLRTVQGWKTSSDVGALSSDEYSELSPASFRSSTPPHRISQKRKLSLVMPFLQRKACLQSLLSTPTSGKDTPQLSVIIRLQHFHFSYKSKLLYKLSTSVLTY